MDWAEMTNDQISELAKQAGFSFEEEAHGRGEEPFTIERSSIHEVKRFAELVRNQAIDEAANACSSVYYKHVGDGYEEVRHGIAACEKEIRSLKS